MPGKRLTRFFPIFSGKRSKPLWKGICKIQNKTGDALFNLALYCQRLEEIVENLEERIAALEKENGE